MFDSSPSVFYMQTFRNDLCSISIAGVSRKNKWYEIVGLFIRERVEIGLSQSEIEGEGTCASGKQAVEGEHPKWRPVIGL